MLRTKSGRVIKKPVRWEPEDIPTDDFLDEEYDDDEETEDEETEDEEDEEDDDDVGSLKDFIVEDDA